ncbi:flippase-like domain-containing protein [Candidatus Micrarchaeota archaeon]|nr:flippase-like domain-containing protein [Candidatus Micrarchaeota archaeon]
MDKRLLLAANVVFAGALAFWFVQSIGWQTVVDAVSRAQLGWLIVGAVFYAAMNLLNSFRISWALQTPWKPQLFFMHMTAMLISDFTPGRTGYSSLVLKLRADGFNSGRALKALGVVFAADFLARGILAAVALVYFAGKVGAGVFIAVGAVMLILGGGLAYLMAFRSNRLDRWIKTLPWMGVRLHAAYQNALDSKVTAGFLALNVAWSLLGAVLRGAGWTMVFMALGMGAQNAMPAAILVSALVTALSFVPLSLAGLGLQEGAGAYLFSVAIGISLGTAAAIMLLARVMEFSTDVLFGWKELLSNWSSEKKAIQVPEKTKG